MDDLLKAKSAIKGHEYDVCPKGCRLYGLNDEHDECTDCGEQRFKINTEIIKTPKASMKIMSIGDLLSEMLANPESRELLQYRANRETSQDQLEDIFDGENYKELTRQGLFSNPDDIAIGIYTDGFVNQKKGKSSYTIVHVIIFNLDPSIR